MYTKYPNPTQKTCLLLFFSTKTQQKNYILDYFLSIAPFNHPIPIHSFNTYHTSLISAKVFCSIKIARLTPGKFIRNCRKDRNIVGQRAEINSIDL